MVSQAICMFLICRWGDLSVVSISSAYINHHRSLGTAVQLIRMVKEVEESEVLLMVPASSHRIMIS